MNKMDNILLNFLKKNARASISSIAAELNLTRTTVRTKINKLINNGEILGFTINFVEWLQSFQNYFFDFIFNLISFNSSSRNFTRNSRKEYSFSLSKE